MRVVTTCHRAGMEEYAWRWLDSRKNWPKNTEFLLYREGFDSECPGKRVEDLPELAHFKARHRSYVPPDWRYDVVRFANKVFAIHDALYDYKGLAVWLDADCETYKKLPPKLIQKLLGNAYVGHYGRVGMYTETGLIVFDCSHEQHKQFLNAWREWYLSGDFRKFNTGWHDCIGFDYALKTTGVPATNLSGEFAKAAHPMAVTEIGKYIDHAKGARKVTGISPENRFRKAA